MNNVPFHRLALCSALIVCGVLGMTAWAQGPPRAAGPGQPAGAPQEGPFKVKTRAELRSTSPNDVAMAAAFDTFGQERMEPGRSVVLFPTTPTPPPQPGSARPAYQSFVSQMACSGSAVVVGTVAPAAVRFNTRETFLYTEFQVSMVRWLRPAAGGPTVRFAQAGGVVEIAGTRMEAVAEAAVFHPGATYLLMLTPIPGASAFVLASPPIRDHPHWAGDLRNTYLPAELATDAISFARLVTDVEKSASRCPTPRVR